MNPSPESVLAHDFITKFPGSAQMAFEQLGGEEQVELIRELEPNHAIELLAKASPSDISEFLSHDPKAVELVAKLDSAFLSRIYLTMDEPNRQPFLMQLPKSTQREVEHLSQYPSNCAGGMMEVRIQLFHPQDSVEEATNKLRKQRVRNVSSVYLVNIDGTLAGRVFLQDLVTAGPDEKLSDISQSTPWVAELAPKEEVIEIVEQSRVPSIPVLNADRVVIGVIRHEKLMSIAHQGALDDLQKMVGVGKDEKALSHPLFSVKKRLPWLTINLGTTFLAAFVVGMFEETIAKITALAVLLPVVAGQSGNTGAQAQAVTMRSLALREIRLKHKWRVLIKEGCVGLVNGATVGLMCLGSVYLWSQSLPLAAVIGVAMVLAMFAASIAGATVPMMLTAAGQDPATSSSIILTTITDIVGFSTFLGLATLFGSYLI